MAEFGAPTPYTEDDLLDALRRNMDDHWIEGLLADPSSKSIFVAMAAVFLRVQESGDTNFELASFILTAEGAAQAVCTLRITRPSGAGVTIPTSMRVRDENGAVWRPLDALVVASSVGVQTVDVPVISERSGYWLNTFTAPTFVYLDLPPDENFEIIPGPIRASGGTTGYLDMHGEERRVLRATDEEDDKYQARMLLIPDAVAPVALIQEAALQVLDGFDSTAAWARAIAIDGLRIGLEPVQVDTALPTVLGAYSRSPFFADDGFSDDPSGPLIRELEDALGWFDIEVPTPIDAGEARLFVDDGFADDTSFGFPDLPPGSAYSAPLAALVDELDRKRSASVHFRVTVGADLIVARCPPGTARGGGATPGSWTLAGNPAPADFFAAVDRYDADATYVRIGTGSGSGSAITVEDLIYTFPAIVAPVAIRRLKAVAWARKNGVGVDPVLSFIIQPTTAGAAQRQGGLFTINHTDWRRYEVIFERNPITASAWTLADVAGNIRLGVANAAAVGVTDELRVSELLLELIVSYA